MDIDRIFRDLEFKIDPKDDYRKAYLFRLKKGIYKLINRDKNFVFDNCIINKNVENLNLRKTLLKIDSMSTYAVGHVVNQLCKQLSEDEIYLNIGCWKGFTLISGMIDTYCKVIGVDNFSQFEGPKEEFYFNFNKYKNYKKHFFYNEDYKVFFKNFEKTNQSISFYYYDGEHSYKNQYENLEIADNFLKKGSIVLIDDINFPDVENGTKDFISKSKSNYKVLKEIKTANNHCHPSFWNGILILEKF
jgi:hypothetical protein|tara:strand:+ start:88 stop:825 length:738 start_codon:yes stop_codon:yes gene_type:complete